MKTLKLLFLLLVAACASTSEIPAGDSVQVEYPVFPILKGKRFNPVAKLSIDSETNAKLESIEVKFSNKSVEYIEKISLVVSSNEENVREPEEILSRSVAGEVSLDFSHSLKKGVNEVWLTVDLKESADLNEAINVEISGLTIDGKKMSLDQGASNNRLGVAIRQHNEDGIDTYRIPGLATTNEGTLIAVYDNRRNSAVDLQEDVDVGMSRSTDGGVTWEPMKVIMDMGEWGGLPQDQNGIGDPSVLVDRNTGTIWVAAVWAHGHPGKRNWHASKPGMEPEETSQFVLVKSEDDGVTWSDPINITEQIKQPEWQLLLQGPGKGITMKDGTLVFPAQYKDAGKVPHSTLIYSKDNGNSWTIGAGVRKETTEAQLVELADGSIMINCRNNEARNNIGIGRVVAVTKDLGATWEFHSSNVVALEESTCMASLINESFDGKQMFLFSNPNVHDGRYNMTIKYSGDEGGSWPEENWLLLDQGKGRGYSCMTKIDEQTVGILYEGSQSDLIFQRVKISDILN